ncbi:MAG: amidase family protein [Candidatus Jordarchaeaceae archaeon]
MVKEGEIVWMSALELSKAIRDGELSPVDVVDAFFKRIEKVNPEINAFVTLTEENARKEAEAAEKAVKSRKTLGPLHGVPVAIKDNMPVKGIRTTWGSKLYENYFPKEDYVLVERLRSSGAIIIGKTNLPEFGLIGITDNAVFGVTRNPWDKTRTCGGSSGGSAAAVAAGLCPIAVGNDWGGSLRTPASFCGVFGFKPHLGRIPRWPQLPGFETLAVEGPITRTVADAALMLDVMAGPDSRDYLSLPPPGVNYLKNLEEGVKGRKFAFSPDLGYAIVEPEVEEIVRRAAFSFTDMGCVVEEVKLNLIDMGADFVSVEVSSIVAAMGDRMEEWKKVCYKPYLDFLWLADHIKATDYCKIEYRRKELWDRLRRVFEKYDFLLTPTNAVPPFKIDVGLGPNEIAGRPVGPTGWTAFTFPFNFTHIPAASVPCGYTKEGLPVGLQIVGNRFDELGVLQASRAFEKNFPWGDKKPPI